MEERYRSPDGRFELVVVYQEDDITLGLNGYPWHTHGDVLVAEYNTAGITGLDQMSAVKRFVSDLMENRSLIGIETDPDGMESAWVTYAPLNDVKLRPEGHKTRFRYWNGEVWRPTWQELGVEW